MLILLAILIDYRQTARQDIMNGGQLLTGERRATGMETYDIRMMACARALLAGWTLAYGR